MRATIAGLIAALCQCLLMGGVQASNTIKGQITELWVNEDSVTREIYISTGETYAGPCSVRESRYLVIDLTQPGMEAAFDLALNALLEEKGIAMKGTGQCYATSQHETLESIRLE